jgi:hypothetical protein
MKPVMQTKIHSEDSVGNGNCLTAALASILELPLWMVPQFEDMADGTWKGRVSKWLELFFHKKLIETEGHDVDNLPEFYIACGRSNRDYVHAVVYRNGVLCHDPHYSGEGIKFVQYTFHLEGIGSTKIISPEQLDRMVDAFLAWELPKDFCSDLCVSMQDYKYSRGGTNIMGATDAKEMILHVLSAY